MSERKTPRISTGELAKYVTTAPPSGRRTILEHCKYPREPEPRAKQWFYHTARQRIRQFFWDAKDINWLVKQAEGLEQEALIETNRRIKVIKRNNARVLHDFTANWKEIEYREYIAPSRIKIDLEGTMVSIFPDFQLAAAGRPIRDRFYFLNYHNEKPDEKLAKSVTTIGYIGLKKVFSNIHYSSVLMFDTSTGEIVPVPRTHKKIIREIEAACKEIANIWDSI
ncbi:hypothetical protein KKG05_02075 [bacterium]|nr:hypothetical protein [bacterium]